MATRASYRYGVQWIAGNDEPGELDPVAIASLISVCLLADLFGKEPDTVARAVLSVRRQMHRDMEALAAARKAAP